MCGIAGFYIKNPKAVKKHIAMETMANLLWLGIESRGKKATGFVAHRPGGDELVIDKKAVAASDFIKDRLPIPEGANVWLGHTRLDTKGSPENNDNNHPVVCQSTFVTHNGVIYNDDELFKEHRSKRLGEVDSEAIAMLLDKYGFDEADKALAQLRGGFAIASVNPEKHPDQVLLAKGGWYPLVIKETDHYVIWASERSAIRDAWKVVLGTPPAWNSFRELKEGEIAVVTNDGIEYRRFEAPEGFQVRRARQSGTTTRQQHGSVGVGAPGPYRPRFARNQPRRSEERRLPASRVLSPGRHVEDVGKIRKEGRGTARLFEKYEDGDYDMALFRNADYPFQWDWCQGCLTCVLQDDMQDTVNWGYICDDCYDVCIAGCGYNDPPDPAGFLSEEDLNTLDNWAKLETEVHKIALKNVVDATGMEEVTVDFLIFRCPDGYYDKRPDMKQLADDLDDLYQSAAAQAWVDFGVGDAKQPGPDTFVESDSGVSDGRQPSVTSPGQRPTGIPHAPSLLKENGLEWCNTHHTTFPDTQECLECTRDFLHRGQPDLTITSCRVCQHATKFHMLKWAWCGKHYKICNACDKGFEAVCTAPNGDRLCHFCSRGEKGLRYDTQLDKQGIEVAERVASRNA